MSVAREGTLPVGVGYAVTEVFHMTFRLRNLTPGRYRIGISIPPNLGGFYDGTVAMPKTEQQAKTIDVAADSIGNIDFGVGPMPDGGI